MDDRYLDAASGEINEKLYTTVEDGMRTLEVLGTGEKGRYITALTFGNVHGAYKPGFVKLRPEILKEIQDACGEKYGKDKPFDLVFHGGSGSTAQENSDAADYGVIKMNIDTDTQYAFSRPVVDHMFKNYDGMLKIDGEVGNKKMHDPRSRGKAAVAARGDRHPTYCAIWCGKPQLISLCREMVGASFTIETRVYSGCYMAS